MRKMNGMTKSVFAAAMVAMVGLSGTAWAEPAAETDFEFVSATGTIIDYKGEGGDFEIPATIGGVDVKAIGEEAFSHSNPLLLIKSVTIPAGVTNVGEYAFQGLENLTNVTFAAGSQLKNIGAGAFSDCEKLATVVFPSGCPLENIAFNAFFRAALTEITIPASVTNVGDSAFTECYSLTNVTFAAESQLKSIELRAFEGCTKLANVVFPAGCPLETIGLDAFKSTGLTGITIPASVTNVGERAFFECDNLANVAFAPGSKLETIGHEVFYGSGLTSIAIPASVTNVGERAFCKCASLASVTFAPDGKLETIDIDAFCWSGLTSIAIPASVTDIGESAFYSCEKLASVTFAEGSKLTEISKGMFGGCLALTGITLPAGVTSIGYGAFVGDALTGITLPEGLTDIGQTAFAMCGELTEITLPASVTSIGMGAFAMCSKLTEITLPASVTSIGMGAFAMCSKLEEVTVLATKPPTAPEENALLFAADVNGATIATLKAIKVPAASVDAYKAENGWRDYADYITAMSAEPATAPKGSAENPWTYTGVNGEPGSAYTNGNNEVVFVGDKPDMDKDEPWQTLDGLDPKPTKGYFPPNTTPAELAQYKAKSGITETGNYVEYYTWDEAQKTLVPRGCTAYTLVTDTMETLESGWYVVNSQVAIDRSGIEDEALYQPGLKVNGDVHLILVNGAELVVTGATDKAGIEVGVVDSVTNSLTIYGQAGQSGKLTVTGGGGAAGLGGSNEQPCGTVTINGGTVMVTSGIYAAGIGGGCEGSCGTVTINAGTVTAVGGGERGGVGIGNGGDEKGEGPGKEGTYAGGGVITINGGSVSAYGGLLAPGIGGGQYCGDGTLTINGGTVTANGGAMGAGIGFGMFGEPWVVTINGGTVTATGGIEAAGIGGALQRPGCKVTITGGKVRAVSYGEYSSMIGGAGAGIGGGLTGNGGNVTITGGELEAIAYPLEHEGKVYTGEGIGAGANMDPATPLSSGTLDLSGYAGECYIYAGMDTNGVEGVTEVQAGDFETWHANCYVQITQTKRSDPAAIKIAALAFGATITANNATGEGIVATVTPVEETLGEGEVWAWAVIDANEENKTAADALWNVLNAAIGTEEVGTLNLLQVTNGLDGAFFGTATTSPYEFSNAQISVEDWDQRNYVFARVRESDGAILSVGGVRNLRVESYDAPVPFPNEMLGGVPIKVDYCAWNGTQLAQFSTNAIPLTDDTDELVDGEWYVVAGRRDVNPIRCHGSVHVIFLAGSNCLLHLLLDEDGATLSVHSDRDYGNDYMTIPSLHLNDFNGTKNLSLDVHGVCVNVGYTEGARLKKLNLYGGSFTSNSETEGRAALHVEEALNVYGGDLTADAKGATGGAGIGGDAGEPGCTVNVHGGMVTAFGGEGAPGIGAGAGCDDHGTLAIAPGLHVWVAEESDGRKREASDYGASREQFAWVTAAADLVRPQDFTITKTGDGVYTVTLPGSEDPGSTWAVLGVTKTAMEKNIGYEEYLPLGEVLWDELVSSVETGTMLVGELSFADFTETFSTFVDYEMMSADDYCIQYKTGLEFTLSDMPELDMLIVAKVTDDEEHALITLGGVQDVSELEVSGSKENEVTDGTVSTPYYAWNGEKVAGPLTTNAIPVTAEMETLESGWYVVQGEVTMDHGLVINGDVHLILEDGASLKITTDDSLNCPPIWYKQAVPVSLSVYGQVAGTGLLEADATTSGCTAIGNGSNEALTGKFNLHGGKVIAKASSGSAGIGSGDRAYSCIDDEGWFDGFAVNVYGGQLTAVAGLGGAGIGCGALSIAPRCAVNVLGGEVFASGSDINAVAEGMWTPAIGWGYQTETMDLHANCALTVGSDMAIWAGNDNSAGDFSGLSLTTVEDYCKDSPRLRYVHIAKAVAPEGDWAKLQKALTNDASSALTCEAFEHAYADGTNFVKLLKDVMADTDVDTHLVIGVGSCAVLDLNGKTLDRGLAGTYDFEEDEGFENGEAIFVSGQLTVQDTSAGQNGKITGGCGQYAGGVFVCIEDYGGEYLDSEVGYARFVLMSGSICGNYANHDKEDGAGGVAADLGGEFLMLGGCITNNAGLLSGGVGVSLETEAFIIPTRLDLRGGVIAGNSGAYGGGVACMCYARDCLHIGGTVVITNNSGLLFAGGVSAVGMTLGGSAVVKDNVCAGYLNCQNLLVMAEGEIMSVLPPLNSETDPISEGAEFWVDLVGNGYEEQITYPVRILTNCTAAVAQYFHSNIPDTTVFYKDDSLWIGEAPVAPEGSADNPWDVGTNGNGQPAAYTNGNNEVVVTGEGLPKPYGGKDPAPWAEAEPEIETIYVPQGTGDIYKKRWPEYKGKIVELPDYLSFTAKDGDITLEIEKYNTPPDMTFEYSFNAGEASWNTYSEPILITKDQTVYFRKQGDAVEAISNADGKWRFKFEGDEGATVAAGGNMMSLLDPTCQSRTIGAYGLYELFYGCYRLVSAPRIEADIIGEHGCQGMFADCSSLTTAPVVDADEISLYALCVMFNGAQALNEITVGLKDWSGMVTYSWVQNVAPFGVFRCPAELPIEVGEDRIPNGWIVYKKFSIPAIEGLSHSVTDSVTGEEIVPCGVSQDGTKTYEVLAGGEDKYLVLFEDVEGYPVAGTNPLDLGDLSDSVEIGSDKYPLPERGVLLTVKGAPEHSKFTIYCDDEEFDAGDAENLTTRVPSNVITRVVYTAEEGWAYAFEDGQPVTERVQLEDCYVKNPTEVSAPTELPDNYAQVLEKVDEFEKTASESLETMRVTYGLAVVDVEVQEKQAGIQAWVTMIKANPLPSSETLVQVEQAKDDFDAWCAQLKKDADEFVAALKEAEEKTKAAGAELKKLGPTKYYEEKGAALIKTAQADVDKIKTDGKPPVKDQTANLQNAMKKFEADFEKLKAEIAAFKQAKAAAEKKLDELIKNNDELMKIPEIAYRWGKMEASKDPAVQNYVGDIVFSKKDLENDLAIMRSELDAAQNTDDVSKISEDATKANDTLEDIRTRILSYQIPEYTLTVNVVHPYQVSYSVYTGETAQVAIVEKLSQTAEFHFVWETPVKVVYHLTDDWYAFDAAKSKTERDFVALDAIKEMMQHDRNVDEPALGNLKDLVGTYDGVKGQFDAWEKDAGMMSEELKGQIQNYIDGGRKTAENLYTKGVPVGETCEKINDCKDEVWSKIEPLFKQGYLQLAAERGNEFKNKYSQFLDENAERINEIKQYGTPESDALIAQVDQLKNNCEALINQINSGSIDNKTAYEALLTGKQKFEAEMEDLAKQLAEAIRYVTALPISADRDFNGSVIVRSTQGRISGEQAWLCLWFPKYLEGEEIWRAEQLIGRKFREIPAEELYQWCGGDCIIMNYGDQMLGNLYPPEDMTACVIVAIDEQGNISRVGGIVGLDELAPGEVKGADIACGGAMSISYYESKEGNLFQQTAMAMPLTSGEAVTLDGGVSRYYAVLGDCEVQSLTVQGDVWLILGRGCDFSVLDGIVLEEGATLHICSEHYFLNEPHLTGRMTIEKTGIDTERPAAIYGQVNRSWLEIHGGVIDISSDTAGIGVANFRMANGDVTVTGGESYAGIYLDGKAKAQCRVEAGTLNVVGGAGAAAIGGNPGRDGGSFEVLGGLVRADATPTEDGKCGASIGAGAGSVRHNQFVLGNNLSIFTAENATSKMQITDAKIYDKMRHPSVLITTGTELIQPLPFTLNKNGSYNLQMPGLPRSQYAVFALAKDDLARAYGEGSTVGAEIWKTVSRIATGARVAVGEITRASLERSLHEMGVKTIYISYSQIDICDVYPYGDIAMIVTFDCDEQGQVVRLGGIHVPDSMTDGSTIDSPIGHEAIGGLTFELVREGETFKLQNLIEEPGEGEKFMLCCYTKDTIAGMWETEDGLTAAVTEKIGREVGSVSRYEFSGEADEITSDMEFDRGSYAAVVVLIYDEYEQVKRIGVATRIDTMGDGVITGNDVALIGSQSFTVRADNSDWATIQMPGWVSQGQAWLWVRVSDETMYEELDAAINGLIGQPVGAEGTTLRPLDATEMPAIFGSGNWGIFTGGSVEIRRYDAMNGNPMRGVMVFKVATLPTTETGSEMMILTVGGVKNVDKLIPGQELSNQYGEDVEHIANQPLTVTRQGDDKQSLLVVPEGELPENGSWYYLPINSDFKIDLGLDARLLTYLGAAVGDLTLNTLGNWGYWPSSTTESSFTVPGDTEAVYLFKVDASGAILTIGLADELKKLYEPGMSKGDTFGKTFIAAQDFGVTRAGEVLTASVYERDAIMAEDARDRFICFTYEDEDVADTVYRRMMAGIVNGTTEVGTYTLASLGGVQPKVLGTFTTDELSLELPAGYRFVFVARVHGADDVIVTLGSVPTGDVADGETAQPNVGFLRVRPFLFTVTREENGTFALETQSRSRPDEQWMWVAVPPHVRYVMEQKYESSERLLELLRREMVVASARTDRSLGKSEFLASEMLQVMLGEGYYGTSLDAELSVDQIPADTEVVMVFKFDRATGGLRGEGAVIGLEQLTPGQTKQNQILGMLSYMDVDAGGNRTLKETEAPVEPITELTASIGGGRWYVLTDLNTVDHQTGYIGKNASKRITVDGEANIILLDSGMGEETRLAVLNGGFAVNEGATLNVYGQQMGNGALQAIGADGCAAIGGDEGCGCGTVNIHGGVVMAEAGAGASAIGGGYLNGAANGTVNLYGGIVCAIAGEAAAIGGGRLGCGCDVNLYPAATVFCAGFGEEEPIGVGGCDGLANGEVVVHGGNRVYLEADEAFVPHPYDYYFGDVRRGNFVATQLLTVSLPKDERVKYNVTSLTLGGDFGGVLPGDDACTYKVLRGDTIVVTAITADEGLLAHGFRSPNVFKFDCVQSDVTVSADDLKVAPKRAVTPMDFTVSRDRHREFSLRVNETFAPGEYLVYGVIPDGVKPPLADPMIAQLFNDPASVLYMMLGEGLFVGEQCCDEYALMLGAKNWNIAFDYAGEEIPLPANARHVLAFKVYDGGRYAALAQSGKKILKGAKKKGDGRMALIKVGAIDDVFQIQPEKPLHNQVSDNILIARQPFALTRNEDETFRLNPVGQLDAVCGEKWGVATLTGDGLAAIESGVIEGLTLDTFKMLLDCMIGRSVGAVSLDDLQEFAALFSQFETFEAGVVTCPKDTVAVIAFKTRMVGDKGGDKGGDAVCAVGYTFGDLQAMTPGGTERKGDEIDGVTDAPTYFVTIEHIPDGVKMVTLTYSFGETKHETTISADVSPEGTAQFAVPEGVNVEIEFEEPSGYIFRTKNSVKIKAIHQDELVDASFLVLSHRKPIMPQDFILRRNPDKTFWLEMPDVDFDAENGDRWFYLALNAQDMAMSMSGEPAGIALWLLANQMIGREVGSDDLLTTAYFMNALRDGYGGYTTERFFGLPADAEMVVVCRCFDVTAEDGFTITYVETVGGCRNLQQMSESDLRNDEMTYPVGGEMLKVNYVKWDKTKSAFVPGGTETARMIDDDTTTIGNGEWYAVPPMGEVACGTITVQGTANVIVSDLAVFEVDKFVVEAGATLNVYGQSQRLGTLIVGGEGVSIGSETVCGTINLHGVMVMVEGDEVGIGGKAEGGELNALGVNLLVMADGPAIAGCTVNAYGGRVLAASMSGTYPAIHDGLAIKNGKMGLFASADPSALAPTTVADYLGNRQPFAKIVEKVNIILPKVDNVNVTVAAVDVISGELTKVDPEELEGAGWLVYRVERFDNVMVEIEAESGYQLRSPNEYLFYSIDSDKQLPADAIVVAQQTLPPQMIAHQPFSIIRTSDELGPCCELKPIGELGPGEKWFWMSCDKTLAQTTDTIEKDLTTEEAVAAMLNQAIGYAPVGYLSLDLYGLRMQLPVNQSGVGTAATFRLPADTDLVLLSKVYDGGLQYEGTVRYFNVTLGLSTNLTARMEQGDSGHNDVGEEPTDEEIETILRKAFPIPHEVTQNEDGSFRITLWADMTGPVKIPDNIGSLTLDMNGYHIVGTNGVNGADGGNALVFTDSGDVGATTELTVVEANEKYNPEGDIVGGDGADGQRPGKGGAAIRVDTKRGVVINVEGTVLVIGGKGGALLDGDKGDKPGTPGAGVDPQDTRGDRAPGSVQEGDAGGDFKPWAKAKLGSSYSADVIAPLLPEGVTVVGNELWFWKRTTGEVGEMIGFDFGAIDTRWIDDGTIRFAAGQFHVDQFTCDSDLEGLTFVGADSAAVVIEDKPFTPVEPEEEQMKPVLLGGKGPALPDLGKHTVLVSTGKSIFQSRRSGGHLLTASGPLGEMLKSHCEFGWRNLGFTALPGTEIEGNGGAISVENVATLTVADCAFADLTAGQMGGAIYAAGLGDGGLITNSTFTGCSVDPASGLGGAIYAVGGRAPLLAAGPLGKKAEPAPLTVADCVFTLNEAESGGAICTSPMDALEEPIALEIVRSTFNGNTAEYNGGAICAVGKVTIADAEAGRGTFFAYNEAGVYGGALAIDGIEDAHVDNEVFVGSNTLFACNRAENDWFGEALGGAINLPENCTLAVRNALFTNNVAQCTGDAVEIFGVYGGAICTASGCENVIEKTYFVDNRAIAGGSTGDRYAAGGALSDVEGVLTRVDTCVFDGNLVEGQAVVGAALDLEYDEESAVVNSTFRRSNVEAISAYATPVVIRNCVVVDNGAEADIWIEETLGYELTFTAYGKLMQNGATEAAASSNNFENCVAAEVYRGETMYLATNEYNKVAALGYPQPGVTDIEGVEYGSKFWGTSMGAFETPAIYPIEELGFEIAVDPLELAWTGTRVHPTSVVVTNPFTRVELTEGVDYTVSFENDVDSTDKALVVVTGIGDYSGTATTNYWITSYLVRYYACEKSEGDVDDYDRLLEEVQLGSLNGSNVVAKIAPPTGYVLDPFHEGTLTNGTVTLFDGMVEDDAHGRLVLKVFYAKSSGGDDDIPDKYQRKITYKVVNGWWDDPDNGLDHTVWVTLLDEEGKWSETGTGTLEVIPTVGNTPFSGYAKTGVWYPAEPSVSEMTISREYPAIPFFLYVYCPQPQGGSGRGGRGGTAGTVTDADLDALRSHLATKFTFTKFAFTDGKAAGEAWASVVDESTGKTLVDVDAAGMKLKVLGTTDLSSGEWTPVAQPTTDGEGAFSFELPDDGASQQFFKLAPVEK